MKNGNHQADYVLAACGIVPVVWLALLAAPDLSGGLFAVMERFPKAVEHPFHITVCTDSIKAVLISLLAYGLGIGIYCSTRKNYRRGEEHGSAVWGNAKAVNKKYSERQFGANKLMTQNVRICYDSRRHRMNLLTLVIGGSGSGKTRFYAKPSAPVRAV